MRILVCGSLAFDRIMPFPGRFSEHILPDKIHILNVCFLVNGVEEKFGGTAGNIAYSLALLGEKPVIVGCAGKDFGPYDAWLAKLGLSREGIRRIEDEHTAGAYITTDLSDNQITGFNPGAMKHPSNFDFSGCNPSDTLAIISPTNVTDMIEYPRALRKLGIPYIFDPGQQIPALSGPDMLEAITGSFMLVTNDYELEMVMKATEAAPRPECPQRRWTRPWTPRERATRFAPGCSRAWPWARTCPRRPGWVRSARPMPWSARAPRSIPSPSRSSAPAIRGYSAPCPEARRPPAGKEAS